MRCKTILFAIMLCFAAAVTTDAEAAEARHFSFAYDQPHTTAYGIAADTFANKLAELSHGTMIVDQFPGAQLGQEPQVLQKLRTGDIDFAITSTANSATVQPESGVFSIHFVFRSEDHLKKALADPAVVAAFREMMNSKVEGAHTLALGTMGFRDIYSKREIHRLDDTGLQRCVDIAKRHVDGLGTIGREHRVFGRRRLDPHLDIFQIVQAMDLVLTVDISEAHCAERQGVGAFDL